MKYLFTHGLNWCPKTIRMIEEEHYCDTKKVRLLKLTSRFQITLCSQCFLIFVLKVKCSPSKVRKWHHTQCVCVFQAPRWVSFMFNLFILFSHNMKLLCINRGQLNGAPGLPSDEMTSLHHKKHFCQLDVSLVSQLTQFSRKDIH